MIRGQVSETAYLFPFACILLLSVERSNSLAWTSTTVGGILSLRTTKICC